MPMLPSRTGSYKFMGEEPLLVRRRGGGEKPERRPRRLAPTAPHPTVSVPERTDLPLTILCSAKSLCIFGFPRRSPVPIGFRLCCVPPSSLRLALPERCGTRTLADLPVDPCRHLARQ